VSTLATLGIDPLLRCLRFISLLSVVVEGGKVASGRQAGRHRSIEPKVPKSNERREEGHDGQAFKPLAEALLAFVSTWSTVVAPSRGP
jgi:hypothetical protein